MPWAPRAASGAPVGRKSAIRIRPGSFLNAKIRSFGGHLGAIWGPMVRQQAPCAETHRSPFIDQHRVALAPRSACHPPPYPISPPHLKGSNGILNKYTITAPKGIRVREHAPHMAPYCPRSAPRAPVWLPYGPHIIPIWSPYGSCMGPIWPPYGPHMVPI